MYVSLDRDTVLHELYRRAQRFGLSVTDLLPRSLLTLHVQLSRVLDLCDAATALAWDLTRDDLGSDDMTACQEVGRAARREGYEGIRFPAAAGAGDNIAIFLDRLHPGSHIEIAANEDLALDLDR